MGSLSECLPEKIKNDLFHRPGLEETDACEPWIVKQQLKQSRARLDELLREGVDINTLVCAQAWVIDQWLTFCWKRLGLGAYGDISLMAVGGYGRGELHPGSDIDLLILLGHEKYDLHKEAIQSFLTFLWDICLRVGSSVRSVRECAKQAVQDLSILTNLMESRPVVDKENLHRDLLAAIAPEFMWPSKVYLQAKYEEQRARHKKYNETEYSLEPNVKSSPGGLRDLHMLGWVAKRHYGTSDPKELMSLSFLTRSEYQQLIRGRAFLWKVRWALHMHAGKSEDRLLFDYQRTLAEMFDYKDRVGALAVEQFMQRYFRTVLIIGQMKDIVLQHFHRQILNADVPTTIVPINDRFRILNNYIEVTGNDVFNSYPPAMLEMFVLMTRNSDIQGVRAPTIRLLREGRHRVDRSFRQDPRCTKLFMQLLQAPYGLTANLRRMARYGILGRYLPEFGRIIGQMQFDLFHTHTVDAHTILVIKYLRSFFYEKSVHRFPIAAKLIREIKKPELLCVAALYHDIGKGRGGDHSVLGAKDAEVFCRRHGIRRRDTRLVVWLVREHLTFSMTSQKKDLSDPEEIRAFARKVGDIDYLNHLYLLTVADINATNADLWNGWRSSLLQQLYSQARFMLENGVDNIRDRSELILDVQKAARVVLTSEGIPMEDVGQLWQRLNDSYFSRHDPVEIVWHTHSLLQFEEAGGVEPLVLLRETDSNVERSGSQIFIYTRDRENLFATVVAAIDRLRLNIQDARIITSNDGFSLDTFTVLELDGSAIGPNKPRIQRIKKYLRLALSPSAPPPFLTQRRTPRKLRYFSQIPDIRFTQLPEHNMTRLEIEASDRPGLLARIGGVFSRLGIRIHNAKVATYGEKLEDNFYITTLQGEAITDKKAMEAIRKALTNVLQPKGG